VIQPRKSVMAVEPYSPPLEGRRGFVRLDFNENTEGLPWAVPELPPELVATYPEYSPLRARFAQHFDVDEASILLTNGSGEGLFLAAFAFVEPGQDRAVVSRPTFALIPHNLKLVGSNLIEVPATRDLEFDVAALEEVLRTGPKIAMFASPDNPTGAVLEQAVLARWCDTFRSTLFVVDEAYAEYGGSTVLPLVRERDNLLVLRTFSKAYALAGLRLGAAIGNPTLIEGLARVRCPYSVNSVAVQAAERVLERDAEVLKQCGATLERKQALLSDIAARGYRTIAGHGNFFLVQAGCDAASLCTFCRDRGLLVRDRSSLPGMKGFVRVTVGTDSENRCLLECLDQFRSRRALVFDLDGTLVETSSSFDAAVSELVRRHSGAPVSATELRQLRSEGGFNDDWDAVVELLRRRGVNVGYDDMFREGRELYFGQFASRERLLVVRELMERLGRRYRLFVFTGRHRDEFEAFWSNVIGSWFERVYCRDDFPQLQPKPAPDCLLALIEAQGVDGGFYVGDSVDDMRAAAGAGLVPIGVTGTLGHDALVAAGAELVVDRVADIEEVLG
jgi:histidinol-phosphate aminotransferase